MSGVGSSWPSRRVGRSRVRSWRLLVGVAVAMAVAGTGLAAGDSPSGTPPPAGPPAAGSPLVRGGGAARPDDPGARQRSRSAHEGENRDQAVSVAKHSFGADHPLWQRPEASDGGTVEGYVGDRQAVERVGSRRLFVRSTSPLVVVDGSNTKRPVSLTLTDSGGAWAPAQPLVGVRLAKDSTAAISLAGGIEVTPGSAQSTEPPAITGNRVVYANSAPDSDFMAEPIPSGVETMWQLRSERSPQSEQLRFRLPLGARLQMSSSSPGSAEIVRNGQQMLLIPAAVARDAVGASVPLSMSVSDPQTLDVRANLSGAVHFPVLVDPVLEESNGNFNNVNVWPGWQNYASSVGWGLYGYGGLLQVLVDPAQHYYPAGSYGDWYVYQHGVPGQGAATITRVDTFGAEHQQASKSHYYGGTFSSSMSWVGGYSINGYWGIGGANPYNDYSVFDGRPLAYCAQPNPGGSDSSPSNPMCNENVGAAGFAFGLSIDNPGLDVANDARITGASVKYLDTNPPDTVTVSDGSTGWVQSLSDLSVYGHDNGLGVQTFTANVPGQQQQTQSEGNCFTPTNGYFCPPSDTKHFNFSNAPEGRYNVTAAATDEVGNQATAQAEVKIDHTPPTLQISGRLHEAAGKPVNGTANLSVDAADGPPGGSTSGVAQIQVLVDGQKVDAASQQCDTSTDPDECTLSINDWPLAPIIQ